MERSRAENVQDDREMTESTEAQSHTSHKYYIFYYNVIGNKVKVDTSIPSNKVYAHTYTNHMKLIPGAKKYLLTRIWIALLLCHESMLHYSN